MSEQFQTRTEFSRSLEDAEKYRAIETLKEVGLLIPLSDIETYHGRTASADEATDWHVDTTFSNASNDSGNYNINGRSTLYTGEKQLASEFADQRSKLRENIIFRKFFEDKVTHYTSDQRRVWLDKINAQERKWSSSPRTFTDNDLARGDIVRREAEQLMRNATDEERQAFRKVAEQLVRSEVHEILSSDSDAMVIDLNFDASTLDTISKQRYFKALSVLALPITEGSPLRFEARDATKPFAEYVNGSENRQLVYRDEINELTTRTKIDLRDALQLAGAYNSYRIVMYNPMYLSRELINHSENLIMGKAEVDGQSKDVPINLEYVEWFLRQAHIVGVKQEVDSATVNKTISSVSFFDLERIGTRSGLQREKQIIWQKLGTLTRSIDGLMEPKGQTDNTLMRLFEDAHAGPDKLVSAASMVEGYDAVFESDAGNWEGYTLAEHTETVLRNFDDTYADTLPVELLAPMRLAIIVHDLGKPVAVLSNEKHKQKEYNTILARDYLDKLEVDERLKVLLLAIIGDGVNYVYQEEVGRSSDKNILAMRELAESTLREVLNVNSVSQSQIDGFIEMCRILFVCDGGAYTSMATTRRPKQGRYRNAASFNSTFAQPVGLGKRSLKLRKVGQQEAQTDLAPKFPS